MKLFLLTPLFLAGTAALAAPPEPPKGSAPVASPNRQSPSVSQVHLGSGGPTAVQVVDANGKAIGRSAGGSFIFLVNGRLTILLGVTGDCSDTPPYTCASAGLIYKPGWEALYYMSSDCSGTPAIGMGESAYTGLAGVPQIGAAQRESDGSVNVYVADVSIRVDISYPGSFGYGTNSGVYCYAMSPNYPLRLYPVTTVFSAADLGPTPFWFK